ncbi:Zinc finger, C2H2 [Phytophthora cactorum]|nr:Zinc finger, C2H2 [Phytophthora cactorum]
MAGGGQPTDSGSSGDVHASGLTILAESSVARTMNSEEMTAHRDAEQEQVRVKLEKARTRMGSSLAAIPTGREYDSRPDALDEPVYDALEKAYNAAFLVHPPAEAELVHKEEPMVRHKEKLSAEDGGKVTGPGLKESKVGWTVVHQKRDGLSRQLAQDPKALTRLVMLEGEVRPQLAFSRLGHVNCIPTAVPMSALNRTSSEDGFLSTPEPKRKPHHMTMKADAGKNRVGRADHLSLNEFLVSELEVYCSQLLERGLPKRGSSGASDLARITGLQLFQDHQRALMDFDDEWTSFRLAPTTSDELPRVSSTISANPFQQGIANPIGVDEWATLLTQQHTSAFYVVVAAGSDLARWEKALSSEQLYPVVSVLGKQARSPKPVAVAEQRVFLNPERVSARSITSYEVFMEDISIVASLQCQLSVIDIPRQATDQIAAIWPQLLSLRCRQRLLLCQPSFNVDARKLVHFLVPELFSSWRKLLVESCTKQNSEIEMAALDTLNKQGIEIRSRPSGHVPAKGKLEPQDTAMDPVDSQLTIKAPNALKKRRGNDGTPGSRQRIGRCGKCSGCLAEDCMKCGHCQDMKKYGGPGLRKQSCKDRKCLNPKIWGYATRKRKRSKTKRAGPGDTNSVKGDMEVDDDGSVAYSSVESDGESVSTATYGNGDSDDESLRYSDATMDSPECERYVKPRLVFACVDCAARFSSSRVLNFHTRVEHATSTNQGTLSTLWERDASRMFLRPVYQNAMISAQFKQQDKSSPSSPLGYAKLEGQSFQYFFVEPLVVLGRMESRWCNLYKDMGFGNLKGLPGGTVDCHIGNDSMIATRHAVISWDARTSSFVIECLSLRTPISVNGREIAFRRPQQR